MPTEGTVVGDRHILSTVVTFLPEAFVSSVSQHEVVSFRSHKVSHTVVVGHLAMRVLVTQYPELSVIVRLHVCTTKQVIESRDVGG